MSQLYNEFEQDWEDARFRALIARVIFDNRSHVENNKTYLLAKKDYVDYSNSYVHSFILKIVEFSQNNTNIAYVKLSCAYDSWESIESELYLEKEVQQKTKLETYYE